MRGLIFSVALLAASLLALPAHAQFSGGAHGGLYVSGGSTAQALSTTAAKMTGFVTALPSSSSGGDTSVVSTAASDIVSVKSGGTYLIHFDCTAEMGTADIAANFTLRAGATAITGATCKLLAENTSVPTNASMTFLYTPTADVDLSIYVASASATPNFTPVDAQLVVVRIR